MYVVHVVHVCVDSRVGFHEYVCVALCVLLFTFSMFTFSMFTFMFTFVARPQAKLV